MDISNIIPHIEALIFASEKPLTSLELTELVNNAFGFMEDKINLDQVESAIEGIIEKYAASFYPFEMKQSGGGWQFLTKKEYHKTVAQLNGEKFLKRLSAASLETLAIIAYKQPITKGEVESIRGVNSDYSIQKLLEKELIVITGRNEELPGKPLVYTTSKSFMDYFGINSPEELPKIKEVFMEHGVEATVVQGKLEEGSEPDEVLLEEPIDNESALVVRGNGELIEEPVVVVDEQTEPFDLEDLDTSDEDAIVEESKREENDSEVPEISLEEPPVVNDRDSEEDKLNEETNSQPEDDEKKDED
jgi:segregation and condensation protein B